MAAEDIYINCSDGIQLAGTLFAPEKTPECAVVIASAMGVPKKFYGPFAAFLSDNGIAALTFDYRGVGGSESKEIDGAKWYILIPALSFGQSSFPARRFGFSSVDVPSGATAQWARWARRPGYFFNEKFKLDTGRYNEFSFPLLAYIFDDDIYAPEKSVKALLERIPGAVTEIRKINGRTSGFGRIGHFGFFRNTMRDNLWHETLIWLLEKRVLVTSINK